MCKAKKGKNARKKYCRKRKNFSFLLIVDFIFRGIVKRGGKFSNTQVNDNTNISRLMKQRKLVFTA